MPTYISLLRGINVSGQKRVLMTDLKALYESCGFDRVVTYIQSGNVIFNAPDTDATLLRQRIEAAIVGKYGFQVPVTVRSVAAWQTIVDENPFLREDGIELDKLYVTLLADTPAPDLIAALSAFDFPPDRLVIIRDSVYLHCPKNYGESKLSNNFVERKLRTSATTRNWRTMLTLLELAMK